MDPIALDSIAPETMALMMLRPTATQKPISAHFPTALALMGVLFCHDRNRIRPTSGMKKDRIFRPVEGLSTSTFLLATAQPQEGQMTALSSTSLPQLLQYFILFSLSGEVFSPAFIFLQKQGRRHKVCAPEFTLRDCSGGDVLTRRTAPSCDGT